MKFYNGYWPEDKRRYEDFDQFVSQIPPGWRSWVKLLCEKLERLGWDGGYYQVKEKFGTLRFYWKNNIEDKQFADIAEDVVVQAEAGTSIICEECGEYGRLRNDLGWIRCLCEKHYKERLEANGLPSTTL